MSKAGLGAPRQNISRIPSAEHTMDLFSFVGSGVVQDCFFVSRWTSKTGGYGVLYFITVYFDGVAIYLGRY